MGAPTDNESARKSNIMPYKFNGSSPPQGAQNIIKVTPHGLPQPPSRSQIRDAYNPVDNKPSPQTSNMLPNIKSRKFS